MPATDWKVQLMPEEAEFIDEVMRRTKDDDNGDGPYIAPVRGGIYYIDSYTSEGYTEDQTRWLLFHDIVTNPGHRISGVQGMRFMNFTFNKKLPEVYQDPEAMDKWRVGRMTTDGQPISPHTGEPLDTVVLEETSHTEYNWSKSEYKKDGRSVTKPAKLFGYGLPVPAKLIE